MRGKGASSSAQRTRYGITPAHAGKSVGRQGHGWAKRDHPRTCGEKLKPALNLGHFLGSPPHMRGKAVCEIVPRNQRGITPAHAGKSLPMNSKMNPLMGSPPHMRGKGNVAWGIANLDGITPAHAGKRRWWVLVGNGIWAHPRTCGEKYLPQNKRMCAGGITPAHAGKSF